MPVLNTLASVVSSLSIPSSVSVERTTFAVLFDDDGNAVDGTTSVIPLDPVVVHVATPRERELLPEGLRTKETIVVFSLVPLLAGQGASNNNADVVLYTPQGEGTTKRFRVRSVEDFLQQSGHYRSFATREEDL